MPIKVVGSGSSFEENELRRKSNLNARRLKGLYDFKVRTLRKLKEMIPIARQDVPEDFHLERSDAEAKESNAERRRLERRPISSTVLGKERVGVKSDGRDK